jgi:hypothetical protein
MPKLTAIPPSVPPSMPKPPENLEYTPKAEEPDEEQPYDFEPKKLTMKIPAAKATEESSAPRTRREPFERVIAELRKCNVGDIEDLARELVMNHAALGSLLFHAINNASALAGYASAEAAKKAQQASTPRGS